MIDRSSVVAPRPSASLLLVRDDPFEVLLVRRAAGAFFPAALVFPGGVVDDSDRDEAWRSFATGAEGLAADERALRIAALRETFEESALFVVHDEHDRIVGPPADCATSDFAGVVAVSGGRLPLEALIPFGHWITPVGSPRRYDTHFFLCAAPEGQEAVCDGGETVALEWVRPAAALARAEAGERAILFPTRMNLRRLAESETVADALAAARARPSFTVEPRAERRADGIAMLIPAEAGYGVTEELRDLPREEELKP
jgi:8-oxo-dGTP pyrophosphatase MutT (NUDIX family)